MRAELVDILLTKGVLSVTGIPITIRNLTLEELIGAFVAIIGMISIYFPIYFKLGYLRSNMIATVLFLGFFFSTIALIGYGLQGDYPPSNVIAKVAYWLQTQADWQIAIYLLFLMFLILTASILLSLLFYSKREF
ncbi:ABC-2 transporter permease [Desulfosporosinus meridiei]|uniref:ABC-2 transporter permease n=1 Tax=Desulfosporosinus meridiei TaxID=79209 RepID=UPI00249E9305|nr:ABC-2 transporter permease [Desulfosporosinus meridiei]